MTRKQTGLILAAVVPALAAIVVALAFLGVWLFAHSDQTAQAQGIADLKKEAFVPIGITNGQDIDVSTQYWFQISSVLHNNGPEAFVPAWDVTYCYPPLGGMCSYHCRGGEEITLNGAVVDPNCLPDTFWYADGSLGEYLDVHINLPLEVSMPVEVETDWDVHCLEPSTHVWHFENEVYPKDPLVVDPDPGNNSLSFDLTLNCYDYADVKDVGYSVTSAPPIHPLTGLPYIEHDLGTGIASGTIETTKTVHNNGPWGPVAVDAVEGGAIVGYLGQSIDPNACVLGGGGSYPQVDLDVSVSVPLGPATYTLDCGRGGIEQDDDGDLLIDEDVIGGPGVDNDGDTLIDEDACDGADNDGDTTADEDDPGGDDDCDGLIDEDSPWYIVNIGFQDNLGVPKDPHVIDPDTVNNVNTTFLSVMVVRPFTPDFAHYATSTDPEQQTKPITDPPPGPNTECMVGSSYGCKTQSYTAIPAGLTCAGSWPGCEPLAGLATVLGDDPGDFAWTAGSAMSLQAKVGFLDFLIHVDIFGGGNPVLPVPGSSDLENDCLPPPSWTGHPAFPGPYTIDSRCAVDAPDAATALVPNLGGGSGATSWSSALDSQVRLIQNLVCPGCALWARYGGLDALTGTAINVLVFDLSGGAGSGPWLYWGVLGDPSAPPIPYGIQMATPYLTDTTLLGVADQLTDGTPIAPETIKYCAVPADPATPHGVIGLLMRQDTGQTTVLLDGVSCLWLETDKQVNDIVFDYANAYPMCQGTELPIDPVEMLPVFEVEASRNVAVSVKSIEYNAGPEVPPDSLVSFYADIPLGCEGQWVTDPTFWPADTRTVGGDPYADPFSPEQWGTDDLNPDKEPGDGNPATFESDLHLQTADYGIEEPVDQEVEILRFFELHCFAPGQYHFTFCNKVEPKPPYEDPNFPPGDWPGNNLHCKEMVVEVIAAGDQADKQVTDIDFDWGDQYPCAGQSLPSNPNPPFNGDQTFSVNVSHPTYLSVTSMEYNDGPNQPHNAEISFFANIPANCEGRWVVDPNVNPLDIRTTLGDPNVGSSGTTVPPGNPMEPGDGNLATWESDLHFYTSDYKMTEPIGVTLPITRFFEVHCLAEGMYQFEFCNRADVQPPETDPVPGNEVVCETVWVLTPNAPGCPNSDASVYDTWTDCEEVHIGTDYLDDCPDFVGDVALPPDQTNNAWVDILDVLTYKYKLQPPYAYDPRFDLNIDKSVDILDVLMYKWELPKAWPCP